MITLALLILVLAIVAVAVLVITGLLWLCWPLVLILVVGIIIDGFVLKKLLGH